MKHIASRANPTVRYLHGLSHVTRERRRAGQTLLDGVHLIEAAISSGWPIKALFVSESRVNHPEIQSVLVECKAEVVTLSDSVLSYISPVTTPSGIMGLIDVPPVSVWQAQDCSLVVLDGLQDPGNLGAMLRTVAAAGIRDVFLTEACAHVWAPRVLRAGMGAHFLLSIHERQNPFLILERYAGCVVATVPDVRARAIYDADLSGHVAWLFGGEGLGLSSGLIERANERLTIPMPGTVESLNVTAAAAVCLFEQARQQRCAGSGVLL